ncbi:MAG: hypothetical protein WCO94_09600 [Verrucomicrobiota bacterium]
MKLTGSPLKPAEIRTCKTPTFFRMNCGLLLCLLLAGCSPSPDTAPPPAPKESAQPQVPTSVVSIPEEFLSPPPADVPKLPAATPKPQPAKPKVLFATSDFQVTTENGIQGIRAGEAVNFVREESGDFVVQYRGIEFRKNNSYFATTYAEPPRPEPTPFAGENPAASHAPAQPQPAEEPPLGGTVPGDNTALVAEQKKLADLTGTIRTLNDQIRSAQEEVDRMSTSTSGGEKHSAAEVKKASRTIQRLKEKRDELSGQLTEIGKP